MVDITFQTKIFFIICKKSILSISYFQLKHNIEKNLTLLEKNSKSLIINKLMAKELTPKKQPQSQTRI